jgi:hypothetical protein
MAQILSIDVGIKHLAYCLFIHSDDSIEIKQWDVVDLTDAPKHVCAKCAKAAKFTFLSDYWCAVHVKALKKPIIDIAKLDKQSKADLVVLATEHGSLIGSRKSKTELVSWLRDNLTDKCVQPIAALARASDAAFPALARALIAKMAHLPDNIDVVLIENQMGPMAVRMKMMQGMILQWATMRGAIKVEFVSSANKLRAIEGVTDTYSDRKALGIAATRRLIGSTEDWPAFFDGHKKKDDLADAFLQGRAYTLH